MGTKKFDRKFGAELLLGVPSAPGVYRMLDGEGAVIYVGKAKCLQRRLAQYRNVRRTKRGKRMRSILEEARSIVWQELPTELEACLEELQLIQSLRPRWNIVGAYTFLYPLLGLCEQTDHVRFCLTTKPEKFPGYRFFGAFRSRETTGEGFFSLMRILRYMGHPEPRKRLGKETEEDYSYVFGFRRLPGEVPSLVAAFWRGESNEMLAALSLRLLENAGARAKAADVQTDLKNLRRFWREEVSPLAQAIRMTEFESYPVTQAERDPLFVRFRQKETTG